MAGQDHRSALRKARAVSNTRLVVRTVIVVVTVILTLYLVYLLRKPLTWLVIAAFVALALSAPVGFFARFMPRGLAIAVVYLLLILVPIGIAAAIVPTIISEAEELVDNLPQYAADLQEFVNDNDRLRELEQDYDLTGRLEEEARQLPQRFGDAASVLGDIGAGLVSSIFAFVTILILSVFMLGGAPRWRHALLAQQDPVRRDAMERAGDRIAQAVANYVAGVLLQATIAGVTAWIVLSILDVPFAGALALLIALFDLIPLVGATLGAIVVAVITLFVDFPTATIVWVIYSVVYQQVENNLIQPQIQNRAVEIQPFVVLVSVLFASTLFGVLGALLAIPVAASLSVLLREYRNYRRAQSEYLRRTVSSTGAPLPTAEAAAAAGPEPA
jgi:predicted PurR-regulated permease PerM